VPVFPRIARFHLKFSLCSFFRRGGLGPGTRGALNILVCRLILRRGINLRPHQLHLMSLSSASSHPTCPSSSSTSICMSFMPHDQQFIQLSFPAWHINSAPLFPLPITQLSICSPFPAWHIGFIFLSFFSFLDIRALLFYLHIHLTLVSTYLIPTTAQLHPSCTLCI